MVLTVLVLGMAVLRTTILVLLPSAIVLLLVFEGPAKDGRKVGCGGSWLKFGGRAGSRIRAILQDRMKIKLTRPAASRANSHRW